MKDQILPKIDIMYEKGNFPKYPKNIPKSWGFFTKQEVEEAALSNPPSLLMLDIDLGFARDCSLRCPTCFRRSNKVDNGSIGDIPYDQLLEVIDEAINLGLRTVKVCGPGEPTESPYFFQFLRAMNKRKLSTAIFTKGQMGCDELVERYHSSEGVHTSEEFYQKCFEEFPGLDFLICVNSSNETLQNRVVGNPHLNESYTRIRNRSLELMAKTGFTNANRGVVINAPVTRDTIGEAFFIHTWSFERGFYPVTALSMVSGKQFTQSFIEKIDPSFDDKVKLFEDIYRWQIENGIITLDELIRDGVSCMPGTHPCDQIAVGLYVTANGNVVRCPGDNNVIGNIKTESIAEIWKRNFSNFAGVFNCGCPFKLSTTVPEQLYTETLSRLQESL